MKLKSSIKIRRWVIPRRWLRLLPGSVNLLRQLLRGCKVCLEVLPLSVLGRMVERA
jgi:hypothetical protein